MNGRYHSDNDLQELNDTDGRDREISLGTTTILGIFFLLALLCAAFFGFGYSMGRRSAQGIASAPPTETTYDTAASKPAPGSPVSPNIAPSANKDDAAVINTDSSRSAVTDGNSPAARPAISRSGSPTQSEANQAIKTVSMPKPTAVPTVATVATTGTGTLVVQVAAVSHQEDATVLMNALKKRGYSVAVRQIPQDKLLHVQIGPFANKKDADAMRQRLLADGYNAIVK